MLTPEEIQAREFTLSRRGYDRADVRNFLARVGGDIERLLQRVRQLEGDLAAEREARAQQAQAAPAAVAPQPDPAAEHLEQASAMFAEISRETQRILEAAQEAGSQITRKAKHEAERELQSARVQAAKLIAEGERRRETIERALNGMDSSRSDLAAQLRKVGGTVERLLRDLDPQPESATTMRAALSHEARTAPDEVSAPGSDIATKDDRRPPESERLATAWGGRAELVRSRGDSGGDDALDPEPDTEEAQTLSGEPIVRARASRAAASLHRAALDQPATEQAAEDAASVDQPAAEESAAEEPAAEEPGAEESGVEESEAAESKAAEVPAMAELSALEHAAEAQAAADEPASDGLPAQGSAEQLVADAAEAPAAEAPAPGQPKVDGLAAAAESRPDAADGGDADVIPIKPPRGGMIIEGDNLAPQALRAAALNHLHPKLVRGIKRGMHDLHNVVLDRLRRAAGETDPGAFLPTDEELRTLAGLVDELLAQGYEAGGIAASRLVDRRLPRASSSRDLGDDFVDDASGRVLRSLMATLRMGLSSGEELDALTSRVRSTFGELKSATAEQLAATHLIHAYELGMLDSWAAGGITHRRWVLGKEPRCPEGRCRHNDQTGALALTEAFPSGHDAPPVHVGCTCTTVPISEPA